jgi:carotenoid cleavage dioxygenase
MGNRYLEDNFAPVREEVSAVDLEVTGEIPESLDGRYLRIGPNPVRDPDPDRYHWFTGDGMVHGVRISAGSARWYRNRYVRAGKVADTLGEPRHGTAPSTDFAANTNVIKHAGRTFALVEGGPLPYELTEDLDTVGPCDFGGTLRHGYAAHTHQDPDTGELHAVSYHWARGNRVDYTVLAVDGTIRRTVEVQVGGSPMMHDFALTEKYIVLYDLPVTFNNRRAAAEVPKLMKVPTRVLLSRIIGKNPLPDPVISRIVRRAGGGGGGPPYTWNPKYSARLGLLPREGTNADIRWFDIEPCFIFHTLNAFDTEEGVIIDAVRHDRMFASHLNGPNEGPASLTRFTLDLSSGKVREDRLDERSQEFPRINERLTGRPHRYGYSIGLAEPDGGDCVIKHDLLSGSTDLRDLGNAREASEFCFVPRSATSAEDDGVLMGYVYDPASNLSDLVMLDAQTLEEVAAVHLPVRVPAGFHGNWTPTVP